MAFELGLTATSGRGPELPEAHPLHDVQRRCAAVSRRCARGKPSRPRETRPEPARAGSGGENLSRALEKFAW